MANYFIENYGCQMNSAEIDSLRLQMNARGHVEVWDVERADVVLMNTCSVRATADQRVEGRLGYYKGLRDRNQNISVVLMGCLAQSRGKELKKRFGKTVKMIWGTYNKQNLVPYLEHLGDPLDFLELDAYEFMRAEAQEKCHFKAYIAISHGCNNFCTYCIVPYVRGREVHRSMTDILDDIKRLVDQGVVQFDLLGQNVNSYFDGKFRFPDLLDRVAGVPGVRRLTFLTSHPKDFSKELVEVIRTHSSISRSLHLPFQSGSNAILKRMNRKYTIEDYLSKIEMAKTIPDVELTTDIIVGFPGESEDDFRSTLSVVKEVRYLEAFMYHYNPRPGTAAAEFGNHIDEPIKLKRLNELIQLQRAIMMEKLQQEVGKTHEVLAEAPSKRDPQQLAGRSENGLMVFMQGETKDIGKFFEVEFTGVSGSGMRARIKKRLD